ncbi:MAG: CRTAC1 family protein [Pirellulales bacterium]|nr:CRTAC1 family protein [Pirellulales bacterium]
MMLDRCWKFFRRSQQAGYGFRSQCAILGDRARRPIVFGGEFLARPCGAVDWSAGRGVGCALLALTWQLGIVILGTGCSDTSSAGLAHGHARMLSDLAQLAQATPTDNPYLGTQEKQQLKQQVDQLGKGASGRNAFYQYFAAGEACVLHGDLMAGISYLRRAIDLASAADLEGEQINYLRFRLGVAYLQLGEAENCCAQNTPESCIVPIRGAGVHTQVEGSNQAIRLFQDVIRSEADANSPPAALNIYLASRWLVNVAYMTLGKYPDEVPPGMLIPEHVFQSEVRDFPRFVNIAQQLELNTFNLCGSAIVDDFDNNAYPDIVTSTWDPSGQLRMFANGADGTFSDRTVESGLSGLCGGLNIMQTDFNNDGHLDILVLRGAWLDRAGRQPNSLIRNNGDGTFTDVTYAAGLGDVHYPTQTAAWADYDNDGDLDLFIGNEHTRQLTAPCQLFRNNGDETFTDVAAIAGVENLGYTKGTTWGDFDADGFCDLYVSNLASPNRLYRNNGDGTFADVAPDLGIEQPIRSFPTWFWDFDNDGVLDLFVSSYTGRVDRLAAHYLGQSSDYELPRLYRGDGQGGFENVAAEQGLELPMLPMGSNFGDLDNDGYLDFYLGTGDPAYESLMPNLMFLNQRGKRFTNVTMAGGFGHLQKGHGVAFADLDNDGDADVFQQMGGAYPGDKYGDALFENPGFGNHWIGIKLVGVSSNRAAIGARIHVVIDEGGATRSIYRHVNSGGSFGANPLRQTLGLGGAERITRLSVFWPVTGRTQLFHDIVADQVIQIVEDQQDYTTVVLEKLLLGGVP